MSATPTGSEPADPSQPARRRLRFGRVQKAVAIVPLALLSAAWTASLTGVNLADTVATAAPLPTLALPDGTQVPSAPIEAPASVSAPDQGSPTFDGKNAENIVSTSSTNEIPSVALSAYQRAESVIDAADPSCHVSWQLIAAIGRVESNHGRTNGSSLADDGIAHPPIYGVKLDIADTDAGLIDGARGYDRAVGPMQFIPSTWQAVAVDADNDGKRDVQDINDAALGAAVYLCSGDGDLSTTAGQRSAVFRYNHSASYVNLVLAIADAYLDGDFMTSPNDTRAGGYLVPLTGSSPGSSSRPDRHAPGYHNRVDGKKTPSQPSPSPTDTPSQSSTDGPENNPGPKKTSAPKTPSAPNTPSAPTHVPVPKTPQAPKIPKTGNKPVDHLLTTAQAIVECTKDGYVDNPLSKSDPFDKCVIAYTTTGKAP